MNGRPRWLGLAAIAAGALAACSGDTPRREPAKTAATAVHIDTEEAEAALAILAKRHAGEPVGDAEWKRLFASPGYVRLERRERHMGRPLDTSAFRAFLLSDTLAAREPELAATVESWRKVDLDAAARRALAYLPAGTALKATLYPVIKPRPNSFVFEITSDPAIFMFVDPQVSREKLENTLAHELHHVGLASACREDEDSTLAPGAQTAVRWAGAFGEGLAMLAAAGGPDVHPHAASADSDRARWDRDVANAGADLRRVEAFFLEVIDGRLAAPDSVQQTGMRFFGEQGPWYTVGWVMGATIEKVYGRGRLIDDLCDPRRLLATYNEAARQRNTEGERLPLWSSALIEKLGTSDAPGTPPPADSTEPSGSPPSREGALWLVAPSGNASLLTASSREQDLVTRFGPGPVRTGTIPLGEGETVPGTLLFPDDSTRRLAIAWQDTLARARPLRVLLDGDASLWRVAPGVSLGTTLEDLERLNGAPFVLTGFGYDYSGTVTDWKGGGLDFLKSGNPRVFLRLRPTSDSIARYAEDYRGLQSDRPFASDLPAMHRLSPRVTSIVLQFQDVPGQE